MALQLYQGLPACVLARHTVCVCARGWQGSGPTCRSRRHLRPSCPRLAPPCSYAWWITFFNMTMLILLAAGVTTLIGRFRGGLVAWMGVLLVLLMDTGEHCL